MFRRVPPVAVVLVALVVSACGSQTDEGLQSVRDENRSMFFEVPSDWTVLHEDDLGGQIDTPFVSQELLDLPVLSRVVFGGGVVVADSVANPSEATVPVGAAVTRSISSADRDFISRYLLAEVVFPYHQQATAQVLAKDDLSLGDGFDGVQVVVRYTDAETSEEAVVTLISVTDPDVTVLYSIAVGCSIDCFIDEQQAIIDVIDSWLVNTR